MCIYNILILKEKKLKLCPNHEVDMLISIIIASVLICMFKICIILKSNNETSEWFFGLQVRLFQHFGGHL